MLFEEIQLANRSIQICSFATGHKSPAMERLFAILAAHLENPQMRISIIVNDDEKGRMVTPYARERIEDLEGRFPDRFYPQFFKQGTAANPRGILHANTVVVDGRTALIGSANPSAGALEENYEVMLKVSGPVAADLSHMLSRLSFSMRGGRA